LKPTARQNFCGAVQCGVAIASLMRHLEARVFQDFATIGKEFAGRVLGPLIFGRCANTTIQV
jgi:hypothetical protein